MRLGVTAHVGCTRGQNQNLGSQAVLFNGSPKSRTDSTSMAEEIAV